MRFHRNTIWLIPLCCLITYPLWSTPVGRFLTPRGTLDPEPAATPTDSHEFNLETVTILQNEQGRRTAFIRADRAHTGKDAELIIMDGVNADLFDEEGNITKIIARSGSYRLANKLLTLTGEVVVNRVSDNQFLYTEELRYDGIARAVYCPEATRLRGENVAIDGGSLEYDIRRRSYVLDHRVKCTFSGFLAP